MTYTQDDIDMSSQDSTMEPENRRAVTPPVANINQAPPTPPTNFFTLPPELRNMVYEYLLVADGTISLPWIQPFHREELRIGRVCKSMHQEAFRIYFEKNTFGFESIEHMERCLGSLSQRHRDLVRRIEFIFCDRYPGPKGIRLRGMQLLAKCANLQRLQITAGRYTLRYSKRTIIAAFDLCSAIGVKQLLKVRGCTEVIVKDDIAPADRSDRNMKEFRRFEELLKRELCRPREERKQRKSRGQGRKGKTELAAAPMGSGEHGSSS